MELLKDHFYHVNVKNNTSFFYRDKNDKWKTKHIKAHTSFRYAQAEFITEEDRAIFHVNKFGYIYIPIKDIKLKYIPFTEIHMGRDSKFSPIDEIEVY
jgi:hypothetical protein